MSNEKTILKLSKKIVDGLQVNSGERVEFFDSELAGFGLRVSSTAKTYFVRRRLDGKLVRVTLGKHGAITPEEARKMAHETLATIVTKGVNPNAAKKAKAVLAVTLGDAIRDFLDARPKLKTSTRSAYERMSRVDFKDWLMIPLPKLTRDLVETKHRQLGEKSHAMANFAMRFLRAVLNFAMEKYRTPEGHPIIPENPVKRLSATRSWFRIDRRKTYIPASDMSAWWESLDTLRTEGTESATFADYLTVALFCGLRRTEAERLQWGNIDFRAKTLTVPDTKNHEPHTLPLSDFLSDLLARRKKGSDSIFVFPGPGKGGHIVEPRRVLARIARVSGVETTIHDLRRTFCVYAGMIAPAYVVKRLLNHKSGDVTEGYFTPGVEDLRPWMEKIAQAILKDAEMPRRIGVEK